MIDPVGRLRGGVVLDTTDSATSLGVPPFQMTLSNLFGTGLVLDR
jgi:hypothetical protein